MSSTIDWSKAPEGTIGHGTVGEFLSIWIGADWYEHDREDGGRYFFADMDARVTAWRRADVTNYVARPTESPAWNGEGLPPVGTVCEYYSDVHKDDTWHDRLENGAEVRVIAHYDNDGVTVAAFTFGKPGDMHVDCAISGYFRPIRTPEQTAAEARALEILEIERIAVTGENSGQHYAAAIYDAGYRKVEQP